MARHFSSYVSFSNIMHFISYNLVIIWSIMLHISKINGTQIPVLTIVPHESINANLSDKVVFTLIKTKSLYTY